MGNKKGAECGFPIVTAFTPQCHILATFTYIRATFTHQHPKSELSDLSDRLPTDTCRTAGFNIKNPRFNIQYSILQIRHYKTKKDYKTKKGAEANASAPF